MVTNGVFTLESFEIMTFKLIAQKSDSIWKSYKSEGRPRALSESDTARYAIESVEPVYSRLVSTGLVGSELTHRPRVQYSDMPLSTYYYSPRHKIIRIQAMEHRFGGNWAPHTGRPWQSCYAILRKPALL